CWLCFAPYEAILRDGNHRHKSSCKHYAAYDDPNDRVEVPVPPLPRTSTSTTRSTYTSAFTYASASTSTSATSTTFTSTSTTPSELPSAAPASTRSKTTRMDDVPAFDFTPSMIPLFMSPTSSAGITSTAFNVGYDVRKGKSPAPETNPNASYRGKKWYKFWKDRSSQQQGSFDS
ncbi:hypothetical protein FRC17_004473, partial [Serendipita sp. 399]